MKTMITVLLFFTVSLNLISQNNDRVRMPMLGETAPSFTAQSTNGEINFPADYFGEWKILLSHPADFTPVCTSELLELSYLQDDFKELNTALVVLSIDGISSHIEWVKSIESIDYRGMGKVKVHFPLVSDVNLNISRKYGMVHAMTSSTKDIRAVFIIDPEDKIRTIFYYPMSVGRNMDEIKRTLTALQMVDSKEVLTPANWVSGGDLLIKPPQSIKEADKLAEKNDPSLSSLTWYMWLLKD